MMVFHTRNNTHRPLDIQTQVSKHHVLGNNDIHYIRLLKLLSYQLLKTIDVYFPNNFSNPSKQNTLYKSRYLLHSPSLINGEIKSNDYVTLKISILINKNKICETFVSQNLF